MSSSYAYPPRGMSEEDAARYIGVGTTKFDEMVREGLMPKPKRVGGRRIWDRVTLDAAFTDLDAADDDNKIDAYLHGRSRTAP